MSERTVIPLFRPWGTEQEVEAATRVLRSSYWAHGPECKLFEEEFALFLDVPKWQCLSLNSCTSALHLAGKLLDAPPQSDVIFPAIAWMSTSYLAEYNGLHSVFADVDAVTLNIDPDDIELKITPRTRAIVCVHHAGHACDMKRILKIAKNHNLVVIEDCAHAPGGLYQGQALGTFGDIACFSFQAVKNMSCADGGMIVTKREKWAKRLQSLRWIGMDADTNERHEGGDINGKYRWEHDIVEVGYKYHLNDLAAAIGRVQLQRLPEMVASRRAIAKRYDRAFSEINGIEIPAIESYAHCPYFIYCIKIDCDVRNQLIEYLGERGIHSSVHFKPLYLHSIYKHRTDTCCPVADTAWKKLVSLPLYACLTSEDQERVIECVTQFMTIRKMEDFNR